MIEGTRLVPDESGKRVGQGVDSGFFGEASWWHRDGVEVSPMIRTIERIVDVSEMEFWLDFLRIKYVFRQLDRYSG